MNMKKLLAVLSAVLMVVSLCAACAPAATQEETTAPEAATEAATEAPAETAAVDTTTLRINLASEPENLDPALNTTVDGCCLALLQFGGLYSDSEDGMVPNFADGMPTISEDGMTYTVKVKDGLKWSDGSDLTANDFVYAWQRAAGTETAAEYSYMFSAIDGYPDNLNVTVDGNTITIVLGAPCAYFLDLLAFPTYFPVKQSAVEGAEGYKDASGASVAPNAWCREAGFVSSGAFTLTEWNHDSSMVFTKNPYYWNADNVSLEKIELMLSADDVAIYAAYNAGDLDFIDTVPTDEIANLKEDPEFHVIDNLGTYYICFNVNSELFTSMPAEQASALRRAIASAIDRQYIIDTVAQTEQKVATSWVGYGVKDGNGGLFKDAAAWSYPNGTDGYFNDADTATALQILEDAGFAVENGKLKDEITVEYLINESTGHQGIAECVQQDLAAIGINITIHTVDWATFVNERQAGNFDVCRHGWLCDFNDPINMLELFGSASGNNDAQLGKVSSTTGTSAVDWSAYDELITQIKTTTDMAERVTLMHQAEDMLMATGAVCPIYYYNDLFMQKSNVSGIYSNPYGFKFFQYATKTAE
jgi:peptide/nickel transport system substrate-binding protein/oligopeptide transport system substrate-binding protein